MKSFMLDLKMFLVSRPGEVAQKLRALAALAEDLGLILGTHRETHNHLLFRSQGLQYLLLAFVGTTGSWCTDIDAGQIPIKIN